MKSSSPSMPTFLRTCRNFFGMYREPSPSMPIKYFRHVSRASPAMPIKYFRHVSRASPVMPKVPRARSSKCHGGPLRRSTVNSDEPTRRVSGERSPVTSDGERCRGSSTKVPRSESYDRTRSDHRPIERRQLLRRTRGRRVGTADKKSRDSG